MIRIDRVLAREVPGEWLDALRVISPESQVHSYLNFRWVPARRKVGQTMLDCARWVLYEWVPKTGIPYDIRRMLEDRPPRLLPKTQQAGRYTFIDDYAHELYRVYRVWARPFWVIQGSQGGHPMEYNDTEQLIRKAQGRRTDPPRIGQLKYADFDSRVVRQILKRDRLVRAGHDLDRFRKMASDAGLRAEVEDAQQAFRQEYWSFMESALQPSVDFLEWYTKTAEADHTLRPATQQEAAEGSLLKDTFLATGELPHVAA